MSDDQDSPALKAWDKLSKIFEVAPWLKESGKAVHIPIHGMGDDHQLTWPELNALMEGYEDEFSKRVAIEKFSDRGGM